MAGKGHGAKSEAVRSAAIAALLTSPSIPKAAAAVGISESTLDHWLGEPSFRAAYRTARREVVEHGVAVLQRAMTSAVATLLSLLKAEHEPTQCRAAIAIIQQSMAGVELLDLESRVSDLEAKLAASPPVNGDHP